MGRLVDTDSIIKLAKEELSERAVTTIYWLLSHVGTAYNAEKVLEQIHEYFMQKIDACEEDIIPHEILEYNKAICEIVRSGGME